MEVTDDDVKTRGQKEKLDEITSETPADDAPTKPAIPRQGTMAVTAQVCVSEWVSECVCVCVCERERERERGRERERNVHTFRCSLPCVLFMLESGKTVLSVTYCK